jgi:hypothetical protein
MDVYTSSFMMLFPTVAILLAPLVREKEEGLDDWAKNRTLVYHSILISISETVPVNHYIPFHSSDFGIGVKPSCHSYIMRLREQKELNFEGSRRIRVFRHPLLQLRLPVHSGNSLSLA